MQITSVTVSSQRKLPHPNVDFANLSSFVSLTAELSPEDNAAACAKKLQAQADGMVEQHLEAIGERMKMRASSAKPQNATADTAARLAEKHGGKA